MSWHRAVDSLAWLKDQMHSIRSDQSHWSEYSLPRRYFSHFIKIFIFTEHSRRALTHVSAESVFVEEPFFVENCDCVKNQQAGFQQRVDTEPHRTRAVGFQGSLERLLSPNPHGVGAVLDSIRCLAFKKKKHSLDRELYFDA